MTQQHDITPADAGQRLDIYLAAHYPARSRAVLQRAIRNGQITVNNQSVKPGYILRVADAINTAGLLVKEAAAPITPHELPQLAILYEDPAVVVIHKPAGLLTHAAADPAAASVAAWVAARYPAARDVGDPGRSGIVHRLDRDTSGVMIIAKTPAAAAALKEQFKRHHVHKEYLALVYGVPGGEDGRITRSLVRSQRNPSRRTVASSGAPAEAGKPAITEWRREETFSGKYALLRVMPYTGRTHQIRVHLHFIGHPIVGDPLYVFKRQQPPAGTNRLMLHAEKLTVRIPASGAGSPHKQRKTFTAPLPAEFQAALERLRAA